MLRQWKAVLVWLLLTSRASQCAPQFCMPRAGSCLGQLAEFRQSLKMPFDSFSLDLPVPVMVDDWDGDGADDLLITNRTRTWYFHVTADRQLVPVEETENPFRGVREFYAGRSSFCVHALDWDRDSNLDLAVSSTNFTHLFVDFWRREQDKSLSLNYSIPLADLPSFTRFFRCAAMQLVDWDADGDLDLLVSTLPLGPPYSEAGMYFMEAAGYLDYKPYNKLTDPFQGLLSIVVKLQAVDWDGDGDLDMLATDNGGAVHLFEHFGQRSRKGAGAIAAGQPRGSVGVAVAVS